MTHDRTASSFFSHDIFNPPEDNYRLRNREREDRLLDLFEDILNADPRYCYRWPGGQGFGGYGSVSFRHVAVPAHIFICDLAHGPSPYKKFMATHRCGNGHLACVNPAHLKWADAAENGDDHRHHSYMKAQRRMRSIEPAPPFVFPPSRLAVVDPLPMPGEPGYEVPRGLSLGTFNPKPWHTT